MELEDMKILLRAAALYMLVVLLFIAGILLLDSCQGTRAISKQQPTISSENITTYHTEVRDTIIRFAPDTATLRMLLQCDSAGNVTLHSLEEEQGRRIALQTQLRNLQYSTSKQPITQLSIDCKSDSLERIVEMQRLRLEEKELQERVKPVQVIPIFYRRCTTGFWILLFSVVSILGIRVLRWIYLRR